MFWIRVETRQKGVGLARFENETRIEAFAQEMTKTRLSDTNQSFNDNVIRQRNTPKICDLTLKSGSIGRRISQTPRMRILNKPDCVVDQINL